MKKSLMMTASALAAAALTGCFSHTVDVKPVEVKPVHISLDVNLKVDKELDNYFDEGKTSETAVDPEKNAASRKQDGVDYSRDAMIQRYKARKSVIADLKTRGIVGENSNGLLAFVTTKQEQQAVVREENRDRRQLYKMIAEKNNQTREVIAARAAIRFAERAGVGEYIMQNGEWRKKQ